MAVERVSGGANLIDVLDRVLDKGIVIDAWVRISLVGIDLVTVEARVVVASIDTYLRYAEQVGTFPSVARPTQFEPVRPGAALRPAAREFRREVLVERESSPTLSARKNPRRRRTKRS